MRTWVPPSQDTGVTSARILKRPLSAAQKAVNTALSQIRIFVEHAIGGMKRYNILVHSFRNRTEHFEDDAIGVCAGLWNLVLSY
jgi:hypothetical protein